MRDVEATTGSEPSAWDAEAPRYDQSRTGDPVYVACTRAPGQKVPRGTRLCLDAGCGTGLVTEVIRSRCDAVIGVDYSIDSLRRLDQKEIRNVSVVQANLTALPFRRGAFAAAVCANTLQHLKPGGVQERAVAELCRVTQEDGVLCVTVHHYSRSKRHARWVKEGKPGQSGVDYICRFTYAELRRLIPSAAISSIGFYEVAKIPIIGSLAQEFAAKLFGKVAARLGYGHMLMAVSKKRT